MDNNSERPTGIRFREPTPSVISTTTTNTETNLTNPISSQHHPSGGDSFSAHHPPFLDTIPPSAQDPIYPKPHHFDDPYVNDSNSNSPHLRPNTGTMGGTMLGRGALTLNRTKKTIRLSPTGNFVIKSRVPDEVLANVRYKDDEEFFTMRYTGVTCDPNDFKSRGYNLRPSSFKRDIELFVVVTMYNEDLESFNRTIWSLAKNINYLCSVNKWGWDSDAWKKVVVCIVADGRSKIHPDVLKALSLMGVFQDGLAQSSINGEAVEGHLFEYTAQTFFDPKLNAWSSEHGFKPMQILFCLKERNLKKINSHRWFFNAFAPILLPQICALIDVGTKPSERSLYYLWETFFRNDQIAGACGEIRADLGTGLTYVKNLFNPLVASQNFEYKISNLLDKSLESVFGYISVLPGAFSAYRYEALLDNGPNTGPLAKYFEGELQKDPSSGSVFTANLYLAEDRILCFELVAKKGARWILSYDPRAYAETDVPDTVPEFLSQRRRWLNGSLFASFYALASIGQIWTTDHRIYRKVSFTLQYIYNILNQFWSWFILGNFASTFFFLFNEVRSLIKDPYAPTQTRPLDNQAKIVNGLITAAQASYPILLVCLFIISFGNRPQAFKITYTIVMFFLAIIGAGMVGLLIQRMFTLFAVNTVGLSAEYTSYLNATAVAAGTPSTDSMEFLLHTVVWQVTAVVHEQVQDNLRKGVSLQIAYLVSILSTFGVMFLASIVQFDAAHMFTCLIQYLLVLPSYINVLTVYALSNIHNTSWGTKGDSQAELLPAVSIVKSKDGNVLANVNVAASKSDLSLQYQEITRELSLNRKTPKPKTANIDPRQAQEDDYRGFRTKFILFYMGTNAALFFLSVNLVSTDLYLVIVLGSVAFLQAVKLLGVFCFLAIRLVTEGLGVGNQGKKRFENGEAYGGVGRSKKHDDDLERFGVSRLMAHEREEEYNRASVWLNQDDAQQNRPSIQSSSSTYV
ncbi:Chitin synthase, class 2 [Chytridiales sp. JEL 0842]|nr:Chitin synthase, class 2 [Chytridiales sp. JEL 0842]